MVRLQQYLINEFPDIEEEWLHLLVHGISILTEVQLDRKISHKLEQHLFVDNDSWKLYFNHREDYLRNIFKIWPLIKLFQIEEQLESMTSFDGYLKVYQNAKFGTILANTKMLSNIYPVVESDWSLSYNSWISGSSRILYQFAGLSIEATRNGIRDVVNEVVLHSEKYHNNHTMFKKLVKRQYQLSLTEQNH